MKAYWVALTILCLAAWRLSADETNSTQQHTTAVGEAVLRLLEVRDADSFADSLALTNPKNRMEVVRSARLVLDQAARLGLMSSRVHFHVKEVFAKSTGSSQNPQSKVKGEMLPTSYGITIILLGEPARDAQADKTLRGEYEIALGGAYEFPDGWRTYEGVRWSRFPDGVMDERAKQELLVVSNTVALHRIEAAEDPALVALGNVLIRFLRERDETIFANEALRSFDECWDGLTKKLALIKELKLAGSVEGLPSRKNAEDSYNMMRGYLVEPARSVLAQAESLGIDFSGAEINLKNAVAAFPYMRGVYGGVDGITAEQLQFIFSVKSNQKSKAGHLIAGDYVLAAPQGQRGPARWTIEGKIRWEKFPEGLLGDNEKADLAFENYVGENGALPPGSTAPDIEVVGLNDGTKLKLSDFRGKVVLLEWWATWCGPCQAHIAELQTLQEQHPDWKDRVKIIALSIDDELSLARTHLAKRGWTNSFNVWAGPGGWMSIPAKQFRLGAVPTCYVIDARGKIVDGKAPLAFQSTNIISRLLR